MQRQFPRLCVLALLGASLGCATERYVGPTDAVNLDDPMRYHLRYIEAARVEGRTAEVEATYRRRLQLNPEDPSAHVLHGHTLDDEKAAFTAYEAALRRDPENYWALVALGELYGRIDAWKEAEELLGQAITARPYFPVAYATLGEVHRQRNKTRKAVMAFRQALQLDPHQWLALRGLGALEAAAGRKKEALELMRVASRLAPHDRKLKLKVAQLLESLGAFAEAHVHFRSATTLDPEDAQAWYGRARTARASEMEDDAISSLEQVLLLRSYHHLARRDLADLLAKRKDYARALTLYRDAIRATPGDQAARRGVARALEGMGRWIEALEAFRKLGTEHGDARAAERGIQRILQRLGVPREPVSGASLEQVLERVTDRVADCFAKAVAHRPELVGVLKASLKVGEAGQVQKLDVVEDTVGNAAVNACLRWTLGQARYPAAAEQLFTIELPLAVP